ncbi:hypothetical protein AVR81_21135, partial [Vibrio parahaemolyticus]|uniref:tandem large repeat n=3 Tax=Vibrio parahaemolyticus TaxID=670 RepID=UPI0007A0141F
MATSLLLSACGGGDGGDNTPPARNTGTISGNVFDAPVNGAKIEVFEFKDGKLGRKLASTSSNAFGDYKVEFESSSMPLYVVAQQGSYTDPLTKEIVSSSVGKTLRLEGVVNFSEGSNQKLMLTPLTNIVSGFAKYKIAGGVSGSDAVSQALDSINGMYGFDVNETTPIDITKGGQSSFATPGHQYGALLTAYSSYSYDMIQRYGQSEDNVYTSMHLADVQFRDVIADGLLDGLEISEATGAVTPLTFGQQKITSDVYTQELSQQVLIVVNDPTLNISGTNADDYVAFSQQINSLGTAGETDGVIPPRDDTDIDTIPPTATRTDNDVLAGKDIVDIKINDDIGVESVSAFVEYKLNGAWQGEFQCNDQLTSGSKFCSVDAQGFEIGLRETNIKVIIDTKAIDAVDVDQETGLSKVTAARLVLYTADVLGNKLLPGGGKGHYVNFSWDNDAPVITVTSSSAINNELQEYVLKGLVKEASQDIKSVSVSFKGGLPDDVACSPVTSESGSACEFSKAYLTDQFLSTTTFDIKATDTKDNVGEFQHAVSRDDQAPAQIITYPEGTPMSYVNVSLNGERTTYEGVYSQDTYTADNVQSSRDYLKIDYVYASAGLKSISGIDFANFNVNLLKEKKIPYVRVKISDASSETVLGSSADKLKLVVKYYVSQNNDNNYAFQNTTQTLASTDAITASIPHETILDSSGRVDEVIYYVPFVKEILGDGFKNVSENASQKLVIHAIDESENESTTQEVYFRSSFDLPTMTIVTPFIGARVQLEGLNPNGEFTSLASCSTIQQPESDESAAFDVASCETTTDVVNYDFMRVRLIGVDGTDPHYYQWKDNKSARASVNLNNANIGAYFELNGSNTYYVTELSTYQTGLFDYRWNQVEAGDKTSERAALILTDVKYALSGGNDSFFGFDPTVTSYATNEMLENPIPDELSNDYLHRFLVEAIDDLAQDTPRNNSSDFASAIYDDLSYDGKANGIGSGGNLIKLDSYEFSSDTYRKDLAHSYYNIMTEKYGIPTNIAQLYADDISQANPKLDEDAIFDSEGESIDKEAPKQTLTIETGRETMVGNKRYVAGEVVSKIVLEDPSGIVEKTENAPTFKSMWYAQSTPNTAIPLELRIDESGNSNKFRKEYLFTLNTQSTDLIDIIKFALETTAVDTQGNAYTDLNPYIETLYVDNDYPAATYIPPNDLEGNPIGEDIYLNANSVHELTFKLQDLVGDQLDKRSLSFVDLSNGTTVDYTSDQFSSNTQDSFKVKLCTGTLCASQGKVVYPGDGNWTVNVNAEDNLGNFVNRQTTNSPKFNILIDSEGPIVNGGTINKRLGGNSSWVPDISWGNLSPGSVVEVDMKTEFGKRITLQHYETEPTDSVEPYLFGEQPNIEVRLIAGAFKYEETNSFYVKAKDSAYPQAESTSEFVFQVDNKGPVIELAEPWIVDKNSAGNYVLGPDFQVKLTSVIDDSKVSNVELWQQAGDAAIRTIVPRDPTQPFEMEIGRIQSDSITIDANKRANLFIKAIDEYGFESQTEPRTIIIDRDGPTLTLNGFNSESYYRGNYVFSLSAQDLSETGTPSSNGVNKTTLEYWSFIDTPSDTGTQVDEDMKVSLEGQNDGDSSTRTIKLRGSDVRGNTTEVDYAIKVQNKLPTIHSVSFSYEDGTPITGGLVTRNDPVVITLDAEDASGIPQIDGTYRYGDQTNNIQFSEDETGKWKGRLTSAELSQDGSYELKFKVYNNVLYNSGETRPVAERSESINVQREGVVLSVAQPENFQAHISGKTLSVEFNPVGDVKARTLECWVRENYTSSEAPNDGLSNAYSGVITNPQESYKCSVTTDVNMSTAPVVLITRTVGQNDTETVSKFSFNMMDIEAPAALEDTYLFTGNEVEFDADGNKMLSLTLSFKDNLSGVNTGPTKRPLLVRNRFNITFEPKSCSVSAGVTTCTYTERYSDIIATGVSQHLYTIKNLSDMAGNTSSDHSLELLLPPPGSVDIGITSPTDDSIIRGAQLVMNFKVKVGAQSILENVIATVDGDSYNLNDHPGNFSRFNDCGEGYSCSTFEAPLSATLDGQVIKPSIQAIDVWGDSSSDNVSVMVDNSKPIIDSDAVVSESPTDSNLVRFQFSIRDEGSGIASVKYTTVNPSHVFNKEENADNSHLYFELPKSELQGLNQIRVSIEATDKVGWSESKTVDIDVSVPTITVSFNGMTSLQGGKLAFTKESQLFNVTSKEGHDVKASNYSIDLVPSTGDTLNFSGNIVSSTGSDTMVFDAEDQTEYMYKVTVTDSIGRSITDFELFSTTYGAKGITSIVDYELPTISGVSADQVSMTPTDGKYDLDVTAYVTDKNLSSVTSTADNGSGVKVGPQSVTEPASVGDPYVMHYSLTPGTYTIQVAALDLANHKTEKSTSATVKAATVPELTISTASSSPSAGGVEIPLTFTFSEEVKEFSFSDVKLEASDKNEAGELQQVSWNTSDNITWTATYTTPEKQNKEIIIRVDDDSYESVNSIPGKGDSLILEVEGVLPTLSKVTFDPKHQAIGQSVNITLEFDKEVQEATAKLGNNDVTSLVATANKKIWTGRAEVPNIPELSVGLFVSKYKDLIGNMGEDDSSNAMPITPTLAITPVGNVDSSNAATLQITGTSSRFDGQTVNVEIKAQGSETVIASGSATVQSGGSWTSNAMDISGEPNGTYTVVVTGTNASNVEATESTNFTLAQALPTLSNATFNPTHQAEGQSVAVRLEFDKALQAASAELGGSAVTLTKTADAKVWTGDVVVPVSSELTVGLVVKDYQDLSGNTGAEDRSHSMPITPTLAIMPVGNVDSSNAAALQISGTSSRFDGQTVSVEIKAQGSDTVIASGSATVQSGGAWTSNAMDISGEPNGTYTVVVTGTNASNVEATESTNFTLAQALPTLTSATFNPTHQLEGQSVTVRLEFDKALQAASAELGGSAVTLTKTADAKVWTGDVVVPVSSELTVGLVVKDYQDLSGNTGAEDRSHSMPITPTLAITPVGNVDSSNAVALQITGTSSRFDGQTVSVEIKAQGSETVIASGSATVQSGGAWTSNAMDISGEPNGTYTVVVTGT